MSGKVQVEASLDKEVFYHGEDIPLHISINNNSKKSVKSMSVCFFILKGQRGGGRRGKKSNIKEYVQKGKHFSLQWPTPKMLAIILIYMYVYVKIFYQPFFLEYNKPALWTKYGQRSLFLQGKKNRYHSTSLQNLGIFDLMKMSVLTNNSFTVSFHI